MSGLRWDLNLLIPLRALLEEANVTRAGQRLNLGQSSMSSALAKLRVVFNDELLVRVGRDYELTPFARLLLPQVQLTLPRIERILTGRSGPGPTDERRTFSIQMTDYAAMRLAQPFFEVLGSGAGWTVDMIPLPERPMESERDLIAHDFAVAVPGIGIEGCCADLLTDHYVCLVDRDNPAVRDGRLALDDFIAAPQAVAQFGRMHFTPADRRLRELGIDRRTPRVTSSGFLPLPSLVAGTDLVAVVPKVLADRLGPVNGTIGVPAPFGHVRIDLKLWWHESRESDPAHRRFREQVVAAAQHSGPR